MKNIGKSEIHVEKREDSWKIFTFEIWEDFFKKEIIQKSEIKEFISDSPQ